MLNDLKQLLFVGKSKLRLFLITITMIGVLFFLHKGITNLKISEYGFLGGVFIISMIYPNLIRPLYVLSFGIAIISVNYMSNFILAVIYWIFIVPIGLLIKLLSIGLLDIEIDKSAKTYWQEYTESADIDKQY